MTKRIYIAGHRGMVGSALVRQLSNDPNNELILHSRDDPFFPRESLPEGAFESNQALTPVISDHGGHVGFVEGPPWAPRFWAEEEAARFLAAVLLTPPSPSASSPRGS